MDYNSKNLSQKVEKKNVNTMLDMVTAKRRFLQFIKVVGHISIQIHIKKFKLVGELGQ